MSSRFALVTGASSGIGAATAIALASTGIEVTAVARTASRLLERSLSQEVRSALHPIDADLTNPDEVDRVFARARPIRLVVHSVGFEYEMGWFADASAEGIRSAVDSLLASPALVLGRGLEALAADGGSIGLVTSGAANKLTPGRALYSASKSAVNRLVESVAAECAVHAPGTGVYAISPGRVDTPAQRRLMRAAETAPPAFGLGSFRSFDNVFGADDVGKAIADLALRNPADLNGGIFRYSADGWERINP